MRSNGGRARARCARSVKRTTITCILQLHTQHAVSMLGLTTPMMLVVSGMDKGRGGSSQVKPKIDKIVSRKPWKARLKILEISHGCAL